ncbi:MAG TPA: hypothetical protein VLM40_19790 [Gemmata sp.]|nr:hypothetical protein [Gemmata sp.]
MFRSLVCFAFGISATLFLGCGDKDKATSPSGQDFKSKGDEHGHSHTGGEQDVTLPGGKKCHAVLSAHFSKKGEKALEVSFESFDKTPQPITLPEKTKLTLRVQRGDDIFNLDLKPGPKDERKSDPPGQCSRFEADTEWLKPDDSLTTIRLSIEGEASKTVWTDFDVKKFSHTHDD